MDAQFELDRKVIETKYHFPGEDYNSLNRMAYHGYPFDETTGLSDEEIVEGLKEFGKKLQGSSHPVIKAEAVKYVLDHTRIDVNEHDYFIGIWSWNRLSSVITTNPWGNDVLSSDPEGEQLRNDYSRAGLCFGWLDFDHTVPDWEALVSLGFRGILERAEDAYHTLCEKGTPTEKQTEFFKGIQIEYNAILDFIDRLIRYAETKAFPKAKAIVRCLKHLYSGAPVDTYDVLQLIYLYFMISESVDHYQVRSLGGGLDTTLRSFWEKDLSSGLYTEEELENFLAYFLMQWSAIDNYWGQPFFLGGTNPDGSSKISDLSRTILSVYDKLDIYNPKIQIKIADNTPKDFIGQALEMVRGGHTSIVFVNEDHAVRALMQLGYSYQQSLDSVISGCYEYKQRTDGIGISVSYFNVLKPISLALDNGYDTVTDKQLGLKTGDASSFVTFEDIYKAYLEQLTYTLGSYQNSFWEPERRIGEINPSMLYSATLTKCMETMTDALDGGIVNDSDLLIIGIASAVDALMAVKYLVYDERICDMNTLRAALDANWEGYADLRHKAFHDAPKYGNGIREVDLYAAAILNATHGVKVGQKNSHGGNYTLELHAARAYINHGEHTKATPEGRYAGAETSKNASPTPGVDRKGVTALVRSATTMDISECTRGFCLDCMLHPTTVQGEDGMVVLRSVLETYFKRGGASIQFNIFNPDILLDAQKNPEKYASLQVRVCGWNILWNNMDKKEQDAFIERAKNVR